MGFRRPRLAVLLLMLGIGCSAGHHLLAQPNGADLPRATIHVDTFGAFGQKIDKPTIRLYTLDRKQDLAKNADGLTIRNVPYRRYVLVVWDSGGSVGERELTVNTEELWVRIGLPMPTGDRLWPGGDLIVRGSIKPTAKNMENWWVRIDGVFLFVRKDTPVRKNGTFSIGGLEMGTYLVEVFEGSKIRHSQSIEIDPNLPITELTILLPK
jgi:hypothetical protein